MLSVTDIHLARRLSDHKAVIIKNEASAVFPAYPFGDRRKHPISWVSRESFQNLTSFGGLEVYEYGYRVKASFENRLQKDGDHNRQHSDIEEREVYVAGGVKRPARMNRALSALDRLARRKDKLGEPLLSKAEYEAGQRFMQDYARAGHGHIATQNYMSAGEDKTDYAGDKEDSYLYRIDASTRLERARKEVGPGLDKAVISVCCLDYSLEEVERAESWAVNSGLTILKMGLGRLVVFYGTEA